MTAATVRARLYLDLSHLETTETHSPVRSRFLSIRGVADVRRAILLETATLPDGAEVVLHVGNLRPSGEIARDEWDTMRRLNLVFEGADAEGLSAWVAEANGRPAR